MELIPSFQIFLYDCTEVSPFSLLFFGGDISIQKDKDQETIAVDEWIVFQSPARIAHLVKVSVSHTVSILVNFTLFIVAGDFWNSLIEVYWILSCSCTVKFLFTLGPEEGAGCITGG